MKKWLVTMSVMWMAVGCANTVEIKMYQTSKYGQGPFIGTVTVTDTARGLLLTPNLSKLTPGKHGFHIHDVPNCGSMGMNAGDHLDPQNTKKHLGPYSNKGHLGDLPFIVADKNGVANVAVLAPRLQVSMLKGHALMIHAGGDNYSDMPKPLGGGDGRFACGVIQ